MSAAQTDFCARAKATCTRAAFVSDVRGLARPDRARLAHRPRGDDDGPLPRGLRGAAPSRRPAARRSPRRCPNATRGGSTTSIYQCVVSAHSLSPTEAPLSLHFAASRWKAPGCGRQKLHSADTTPGLTRWILLSSTSGSFRPSLQAACLS
jgi:hypothetical protein